MNANWPKEITFANIWINTGLSFLSWLIWSIILFIFWLLSTIFIDIWAKFSTKVWIWWWDAIFPFILSFTTFIATIIVSSLTYYFLTISEPTKYKKTIIHFWQISFYSILLYIFIVPVYIYTWMQNYNNIMYVFIIHILLLSFWTYIILEVMNNFRYILVWLYASFSGLILSGFVSIYIFSIFSDSYAKLISLLLILPLVNSLITFFKWLFEFLYYKYYLFTWLDQLWDIFDQIQEEEMAELKELSNQNITY